MTRRRGWASRLPRSVLLSALGWVSIGLLLLGLAPAAAAATAADCPPDPSPLTENDARQGLRDAIDRGFLWRVSKGGRQSWLYGTLHVARRPWMFPGPQVRQALQASDTLALELDLLDPEMLRRMAAAAVAGPGEQRLSPALQRRLRQQGAATCAGNELQALKAEMQALTLTVLVGRRIGLEPAYGVDLFLSRYARELSKPVVSLETPEGQLNVLLQSTPAETERFVTQMLSDLESGQALPMLKRLAEAWASSNWHDIEHYADWCGCMNSEADRTLMRRLIDDRNQAMARGVRQRHEAGEKLFVAVGALHMFGAQGLPALLAAQGFEVQRLVPAGR